MRRTIMLIFVLGGCRPDFGAPLSQVAAPRIVAVRLEPAEAAPGTTVMGRALVAAPSGAVQPPLAWSLCLTPKPAIENDVVPPDCLQPDGTQPVTTSPLPVALPLPAEACRLYGPDAPPAIAGAPPPQPRAPDVSGGYFQPVRLELDGAPTIALVRIRCALAGASQQTAAAFAATYTPNNNPKLTTLTATLDGKPLLLTAIPRGRAITLTAAWSSDSPETYPVLEPLTQTLRQHREALTVSWLATSGTFAAEHTGRGETDPTLDSDNSWTAPTTIGPAHIFLVLRDSRGGVDFASYDLNIE
jgi:hypothetical protein